MRLDASAAAGPVRSARRLIVNADDFGRSSSINAAVIRAHEEGILTTASLMVNEPACAEAVRAAMDLPRLGVGLHLSLVCGQSALGPAHPPALVDAGGNFTSNPVLAGWRYFFERDLREPLRREIQTQLERFQATKLVLDHVNGHLHLHLHPVVLSLLLEEAPRFGITRLRLTREPLGINLAVASGRWIYRLSHWFIYSVLAWRAEKKLKKAGIHHAARVFGLLQNARVDTDYLSALLPRLPAGDSELYSHPSLDQFRHEFEALVSPQVKEIMRQQAISPIRYQDL